MLAISAHIGAYPGLLIAYITMETAALTPSIWYIYMGAYSGCYDSCACMYVCMTQYVVSGLEYTSHAFFDLML